MLNGKYNNMQGVHIFGKITKSNWQLVERDKIDNHSTNIHDRPRFWLGTGTVIKSHEDKLIVCAQPHPLGEMMWSCKCFPHASKMPNLTYNQANRLLERTLLYWKLYIIYSIFLIQNFSVLLKRTDDLNYYINIR